MTHGRVDEAATRELRRALRAARLGSDVARRPDASNPALSVAAARRWSCRLCDTALGAGGLDRRRPCGASTPRPSTSRASASACGPTPPCACASTCVRAAARRSTCKCWWSSHDRPAALGRRPRRRRRRAEPAGAAARGDRPGHHARRRRPVLRDDARRPRRDRDQDRAPGRARLRPGLPAVRRRGRGALQRLLRPVQPQQARRHAQPQGARGPGAPARAGAPRGRAGRELPPGHDGQARRGLRDAARGEPGAGVHGDLRVRPVRPELAQARLRQQRPGDRRPVVDQRLPRSAAGARRDDHRRPLRLAVRRLRHGRRAARGRADRDRTARGRLPAGRGAVADRERGRQLHDRREDPRPAGQRPPVRASLRPVPVPGRPRLLRRLHAEAVGRELPHLRPAGADRRSGDRHDGAALRRVPPTSAGSSRSSRPGSRRAPRTSSRSWPPTGFRSARSRTSPRSSPTRRSRQREMVVDVDYPGGPVGMFGMPVKLSETPGDPRALAPTPGQHNDDVYGRALGLSARPRRRAARAGRDLDGDRLRASAAASPRSASTGRRSSTR